MSDAAEDRRLPIGAVDHMSVGWWGMLCAIATEGALFGYLLFSYFYLAVQLNGDWMPYIPSMRFTLPGMILLIISSGAIAWGGRGIRRGQQGRLLLGAGAALLLGAGFVLLQIADWNDETFGLRSGEYGSIFYLLTALHLAHLLVGLVAMLFLLIWSRFGYFDARRNAPVLIIAAYWHFVVIVGALVFLTIYVTPHLG